MIKVMSSDKVKYYSCDCSKCRRTLSFDSGDIDVKMEVDPFDEFKSYAVKTIICPVCQEHIVLSIDEESRNNFQPIENKKEEKTETVVINLNPHN